MTKKFKKIGYIFCCKVNWSQLFQHAKTCSARLYVTEGNIYTAVNDDGLVDFWKWKSFDKQFYN